MDRKVRNVILITIDCLRSDHLGCYGYQRGTSPNIDELASKGTLFKQAISNGGNTAHAFPSMLASVLPPLDWDEYRTIMLRHTGLAEILRGYEYRTAALHSNVYLSRFFNYNVGFDLFNDNFFNPTITARRTQARATLSVLSKSWLRKLRPLLRVSNEWFWSIFFAVNGAPFVAAEQLTTEAVSWIASHSDKFFLWVHYNNVHAPYMPPQEYLSQLCGRRMSRYRMSRLYQNMGRRPKRMSVSDIEAIRDLYDASILHVDYTVGRLLKMAESRLENTLIIITADHGDEFGEHGMFGHGVLYDGIIHVPLIMVGPGIKASAVVDEQVCHLNIAPTILDVLGVRKPATFCGASLKPLLEGRAKSSNAVISTASSSARGGIFFAYRTPEFKYIRTVRSHNEEPVPQDEVYDLRNDPGEMRNIHDSDIDAVREFKLAAKAGLSKFREFKVAEATNLEKQRIKAKLGRLQKLDLH